MSSDKFIDLLELGSEDEEESEDEGTLDTVIKKDKLSESEENAVIGEKKVVESDSFILKLYQKEDFIDSIDIECKCGNSAHIQLEYKHPELDDEHKIEDSSFAPEELAPESEDSAPVEPEEHDLGPRAEDEEESEFVEGFPAEDSSDTSTEEESESDSDTDSDISE